MNARTAHTNRIDLSDAEIQREVADMAGEHDVLLDYLDRTDDADVALLAIGGWDVLAAILTSHGDDLTMALEQARDAMIAHFQQDDDLCRAALARLETRTLLDEAEVAGDELERQMGRAA